MKTCMFLCFHVDFKHESTKTCMFPCNLSINVYVVPILLPPSYHNDKGSIPHDQLFLSLSRYVVWGFRKNRTRGMLTVIMTE